MSMAPSSKAPSCALELEQVERKRAREEENKRRQTSNRKSNARQIRQGTSRLARLRLRQASTLPSLLLWLSCLILLFSLHNLAAVIVFSLLFTGREREIKEAAHPAPKGLQKRNDPTSSFLHNLLEKRHRIPRPFLLFLSLPCDNCNPGCGNRRTACICPRTRARFAVLAQKPLPAAAKAYLPECPTPLELALRAFSNSVFHFRFFAIHSHDR